MNESTEPVHPNGNGNGRSLTSLFVVALASCFILAVLFAIDMRNRVTALEVWRLNHEIGKDNDHNQLFKRIEALERK